MKKLLITLLIAIPLITFAQDAKPKADLGIEVQVYPTGIIPGFRGALALGSRNEINLRLAAQFINHRDLGVHEEEKGNGSGLTLGYRHYFKDDQRGLLLGVRNDIWINGIEWQDNIGTPNLRTGRTELIVVQPTVEAGYLFEVGENWAFAPTFAFGYEVNVKTRGEDTGEGAIILLGVNFAYRFRK